MNDREAIVVKRYEADGWTMVRGGAPDFFGIRSEGGKIVDTIAVEVKSTKDSMSHAQQLVRRILEQHGIAYKVEVMP